MGKHRLFLGIYGEDSCLFSIEHELNCAKVALVCLSPIDAEACTTGGGYTFSTRLRTYSRFLRLLPQTDVGVLVAFCTLVCRNYFLRQLCRFLGQTLSMPLGGGSPVTMLW